jgi:hypothetical protein
MPGVNVQFHMLFDEAVAVVAEWMTRYSLSVELEQFIPAKTSAPLPADGLTDAIARFGPVDRFWLLYRPPRARTFERFSLHYGGMRDNRLAQSSFGGATDKPAVLAVLKQVARDLKLRTVAGVWIVNATGSVSFRKEYRVSPGAAAAVRAGTLVQVGLGSTQSFSVDPPAGLRGY